MQEENTVVGLKQSIQEGLWEIAREGARKMIQLALETELDEFMAKHSSLLLEDGRQRITRNGHNPQRSIQTGVGGIHVQVPRARDRGGSEHDSIRFSSSLIPPYLRRSRNVEELLPVLYLLGISSGSFSNALEAILGPGAPGLSANTISRLKARWEDEYEDWCTRSLCDVHYVYLWADGIYIRTRGKEKNCLLVIIGATEDGKKELVAIEDGYREDSLSWNRLLTSLKQRGMKASPKLAIGDGALGFWKALGEVYPETARQRCWLHKVTNVLSCLPKSRQKQAKADLYEIREAATKAEAEDAFTCFLKRWEPKYPKAAKCLAKDREPLLAFFDFPAEHWRSLRTTNPIESAFSTIRHRTKRSKGCLTQQTMLAMVFKLGQSAQKNWRRINGSELIADVITGVKFTDGIKQIGVAA